MTEENKIEISSAREGKELVVDQLVSFLKSSYVYPANNRRVIDAAEQLIGSVQREASPRPSLTVHVVGREIRVDGEGIELPDVRNDWLRESFYAAGLAGVELRVSLTGSTLAVFAEKLREADGNEIRDFSDVWPEELDDLKPLDLMFRGFHRAGAEEFGFVSDTCEILFEGEQFFTEPLAPNSPQALLTKRLWAEEEIRSRLSAVETRWREEIPNEPGSESARIDLVSEIARLLPAEALRDEEKAHRFVLRVLDELERYIPGEADEGPDFTDPAVHEIHGLALGVAKRFFDVAIPTLDPVHLAQLPTGRPGDEGVKDDLAALLDEFERLPAAADISFPTDDESLSGELLGIYLHRIIGEAGEVDDRQRSRLGARTVELLDDLSESQISVLSSYLAPCLTGDPEAARRSPNWKILTMLREQGRLDVLRQVRRLGAELAAALFPELFDIFLDSLTATDKRDRDQLLRAVTLIGPELIVEATQKLSTEMKLFTPGRVEMVLSVESREIAPLVGVFAEKSDMETRRDIALLLKKLEPPIPESAALRAVTPSDRLPGGYLRNLCQFDWNKSDPKLRAYSGFLLRKYITDTAGDADRLENRVYAIRTLSHLPGPETTTFLRELRIRGRLFNLTKAARAVRQAATKTLEEIKDV